MMVMAESQAGAYGGDGSVIHRKAQCGGVRQGESKAGAEQPGCAGMKLFVCRVGQKAAELEWEGGGLAGDGDECKGAAR